MLKWEKGGESIDWWNFSQYFINTDTRIQRQAVSLSLSNNNRIYWIEMSMGQWRQ